MPTRGLPHYWTANQVKIILDAMPAGQPWLFGLLLWRTALRQAEALNLEWRDLQFAGAQPSVTVRSGKGGRYRVVPAHPELVDAFRSVPHRSPGEKVFRGRAGNPLSPRTAARWISEGITKAGLQAVATGQCHTVALARRFSGDAQGIHCPPEPRPGGFRKGSRKRDYRRSPPVSATP